MFSHFRKIPSFISTISVTFPSFMFPHFPKTPFYAPSLPQIPVFHVHHIRDCSVSYVPSVPENCVCHSQTSVCSPDVYKPLQSTAGMSPACKYGLRNLEAPAPPFMHPRTVALAFLVWTWVSDRTRLQGPRLVLDEVAELRSEVGQAREVVAEFEVGIATCEREVWWRSWALRASGLVDLALLGALLWGYFSRQPVDEHPVPEPEISQPPLAELEDVPVLVLEVPASESSTSPSSGPSGATRGTRSRPTRPSDLKRWRTSP